MQELIVTNTVNIYPFTGTVNSLAHAVTPTYSNVKMCIMPSSTDLSIIDPGVSSYQLCEGYIFDPTIIPGNGAKVVDTTSGEVWTIKGVPQRFKGLGMDYIRVNLEGSNV